MDIVSLVTKPDHVLSLAGLSDPVRAVVELVWNGLDAESTEVSVNLEFDEIDGVSSVTVEDNGHGMNRHECLTDFALLGGSWKAKAGVSPNIKRTLHGKLGRGRLRAFALGNHVRWTTTARAVTNGIEETTVRGHASNPVDFEIGEGVKRSDNVGLGTRFESRDPTKHTNRLTRDDTATKLTAAFALFLLSNVDVTIRFRGAELRPDTAWLTSTESELQIPDLRDDVAPPRLRIIEWREDVPRSLSLCDSGGSELAQITSGIQAPGHSFTAYLSWDGFRDHVDTITLADFEDGEIARVLDTARDELRTHFGNRDFLRRRRQVQEWKDEGVYPYSQKAADAANLTERGLFDEIATTIARRLPKHKDARRTTLRLLREVISTDPDRALDLVDEFFRLPKAERDELRRLVAGTSLASIVRSTTSVMNRFKFLAGLRTMVFDPSVRKHVKERAELHKILENETWVFGDEFEPMVSDRSLDTLLARHLHMLGKKVDLSASSPVRREDGRRGIVDLVLGRAPIPRSLS